jgi:hypothetical protein
LVSAFTVPIPMAIRPVRSLPPAVRRRPLLLLALGTVAWGTGCRGVALEGARDGTTTPAAAVAHTEALAAALEARFTRVYRAPRYAAARLRIARYAGAPSKLVNDTALWTAARTTREGAEREQEAFSSLVAGRYRFVEQPRAPVPVRVGDERHLVRLRQLSASEWGWHTEVEHAVGTITPEGAAALLRGWFRSLERTPGEIRADYRATFPRTAQALGRLVTLDSIATQRDGEGATQVTLRMQVRARQLQGTFPHFAAFIARYVEPARYRYRLADAAGTTWWDAQAADRVLTVRLRVRNGVLLPLGGGTRPLPDTVVLHADARAKVGLFSVGVSGMRGTFAIHRAAGERSWFLRFTEPPTWHLPLVAERLLATPLRRPFLGGGVQLRTGFRTGPQGQALLFRHIDLAVQESAIVRWLGNLGFTAVSEHEGAADEEEDRFLVELFRALRDDLTALSRALPAAAPPG